MNAFRVVAILFLYLCTFTSVIDYLRTSIGTCRFALTRQICRFLLVFHRHICILFVFVVAFHAIFHTCPPLADRVFAILVFCIFIYFAFSQ